MKLAGTVVVVLLATLFVIVLPLGLAARKGLTTGKGRGRALVWTAGALAGLGGVVARRHGAGLLEMAIGVAFAVVVLVLVLRPFFHPGSWLRRRATSEGTHSGGADGGRDA
jgi:hypothetical protein